MTKITITDLIFHILPFCALSLSIRFIPKLFSGNSNNSDTYFHYYLISVIKKNGNTAPDTYPRMPAGLNISYPFFFHYVLSFLPSNSLLLKYINPILDALVALTVFVILILLCSDTITPWLGGSLYLLTPLIFTHQSIGPRIIDFTPRLFGEVLFFMVLACMLLADNYFFILLGGFISGLIFLSSQFSSQVIFLTIPFAVIFGAALQTILIPIIGLCVAIALGKKRFTIALQDKLKHYRWYISRIFSNEIRTAERTWFRGLYRALKEKSLVATYRELFHFNSLLILLIKAPILICLLIFLETSIAYTPFVLASLTVFFLTTLKYFLFLGEADRYIVHYMPVFVIYTVLLVEVEIISYLLLYGFVFYIFDIFMLRFLKKKIPSAIKAEVVLTYLNNICDPKTISLNPLQIGAWRALAETKHIVLGPFNSIFDKNSYFAEYELLDENKLDQSVQYYNLELVFFDKDRIKSIDTIRKKLFNFKEINLDQGVVLFEKYK